MKESQTVMQKALDINLDAKIYGTFAEIGAGQEVARFFFQAGKASQTIAKSISAYDMIYSDEIYGKEKSGRYVCESRLDKMLSKEYDLLIERLSTARGDNSHFFAFANTVASVDQKKRFSHGLMGLRFQTKECGPSNDIILHVRLLDKHRLLQQEALGILGVNLIHAAFRHLKNPEHIVQALVDNLKDGQVSIDMLKFQGPDTKHINNHLMNLELVRRGLSDAILFGPDQNILNVSDELFKKTILIQRGTYKPVTNTHLDVLEKGLSQFKKDSPEDKKNILVLFELTMHNLQQDGHLHEKDFLDRVKSLCLLGHHVLVSNFFLFYRLKHYLRAYTDKPMVLIFGASHLDRLFDEKHYTDLDGGLLEGLGKLLDKSTKLYVYPHKTQQTCMTTKTFFPEKKYLPIYQYFLAQQQIVDISGCDDIQEYIHSADVWKMIEAKNPKWKKMVPEKVAEMIQKKQLFAN